MILFQLLNMQADILVKSMKDRSTILRREMLAKGDAVHLIIYSFIKFLSTSKKILHEPIENDAFFVICEIRQRVTLHSYCIASMKFA